jgi:hypothetical protein
VRWRHTAWLIANCQLLIAFEPETEQPRKKTIFLRGRGSLLGLAEGAEAFANHNSLGLKDSRLKPQPPHVYHYNQNFSFFWIALLSRVSGE